MPPGSIAERLTVCNNLAVLTAKRKKSQSPYGFICEKKEKIVRAALPCHPHNLTVLIAKRKNELYGRHPVPPGLPAGQKASNAVSEKPRCFYICVIFICQSLRD